MKAQKWVLAKQFDGEPKDDDMILTDFELSDELQENGQYNKFKSTGWPIIAYTSLNTNIITTKIVI